MVKKVSIIVVNYDNHGDTIACLMSLANLDYGHFSVIVIDNTPGTYSFDKLGEWAAKQLVAGSKEHSFSYVLLEEAEFSGPGSSFPEKLIMVKALVNAGFSSANNIGLNYLQRQSDIDYIWLLNNDTVVTPSSLSELLDYTSQMAGNTGIIGSKLLYFDQPHLINAVGATYSKYNGKTIVIGESIEDMGQYDDIDIDGEADFVMGASLFLRKEFLDRIGLLNEDYFLYFEEIDWILRGREKGYSIGFAPKSVIYHKSAATTAKATAGGIAELCYISSRILFSRRFYPWLVPYVYFNYLKNIVGKLFRSDYKQGFAIFKILLNPMGFKGRIMKRLN